MLLDLLGPFPLVHFKLLLFLFQLLLFALELLRLLVEHCLEFREFADDLVVDLSASLGFLLEATRVQNWLEVLGQSLLGGAASEQFQSVDRHILVVNADLESELID